MGGPQLEYRKGKAQPFGRFLLGGATTQVSGNSQSQFALGGGGGVDIHLTKNLSFRSALDGIHIHDGNNVLKVGIGITYNFGYMR